jgi:exodeoxyribonuclease-3
MLFSYKKVMKLVTWNVNSIRARLEGLIKLISLHNPDVILLQEVKALAEAVPTSLIEELGYHLLVLGQKSYNGVAILSKYKPEDTLVKEFRGGEGEARYLETGITVNGNYLRVASIYVPNGEDITSHKFEKKLLYLEDLGKYLATKKGENFFLGGDFNVAPEPLDLFAPELYKNALGFHPKERELIKKILQSGYQDTFRYLYPTKSLYSWWGYRGFQSYERNRGWRLDYIITPDSSKVLEAAIITEARNWDRPSDHAPVYTLLDY